MSKTPEGAAIRKEITRREKVWLLAWRFLPEVKCKRNKRIRVQSRTSEDNIMPAKFKKAKEFIAKTQEVEECQQIRKSAKSTSITT